MLNELKKKKIKLIKKVKFFVFRASTEKTDQSKFFGSIGHLNNVWFNPSSCCWRCTRELKSSNAGQFKWYTPGIKEDGTGGWVNAFLEKPKPSVGTISYWLKEGISRKEYEEYKREGDMESLSRFDIKIRK